MTRVLITTVLLFVDDQGLTWAGAIGLYLFLSVPPFVVATAWAAGFFFPPEQAEAFMLEQVAKYLPAEQDLLEGILAYKPTEAVGGVVTAALLLFSGTRAFAAMTSAINVMWRRVDRLTFVRRQVLRIGMLLVTLGLLALATLGEVLVGALLDGGGSSGDGWLLDWQLIPSVLLGMFLVAAYKLLPREPVSWAHAAIGATLATVGVRSAQAAFGMLANAGIFRTPYGEFADIALMATWALAVGVIILFGAALVAVLDGKRTVEGRDEDEARFSRAA